MALTILYFAGARDAAGLSREPLERAPASVAELRRALGDRHPSLARILPRCRIAVEEVAAAVRGPGRGAVVTFEGDVRAETRGRRVVRLEYEAYVPMAERTLAALAAGIGREHGAEIAILHRIGQLAPGEPAVVIAAAAPHRTAAFRACEETIERLKRDVPIWKREVFEDGTVWVGLGP